MAEILRFAEGASPQQVPQLRRIIQTERTNLQNALVAHLSGLDDSEALELYVLARRSVVASKCIQKCSEYFPGAPQNLMDEVAEIAETLEMDPHNRSLQTQMVAKLQQLQAESSEKCKVQCGGPLESLPEYQQMMERWRARRSFLEVELSRLDEAERLLVTKK